MIGEFEDATLAGNERIEEVIHLFYQDQNPELLMAVCLAVRERMAQDGHLLFRRISARMRMVTPCSLSKPSLWTV